MNHKLVPAKAGIQNRVSSIQNPVSSIEYLYYKLWVIPPYSYELFMQNKPNLPETQMNITPVTIRDYKENHPPGHPKNNHNSNPIKLFHICVKVCPERSRRISAQINVTFVLTRDYENQRCGRGQIKPNQSLVQNQKNVPNAGYPPKK